MGIKRNPIRIIEIKRVDDTERFDKMMTEKQIIEQLKRKYDAEMVSALVGAGFTRNVYNKAQTWSGLLVDLVEEAYEQELSDMYQQYVHQRFGVDIQPYEDCKKGFIEKIIARDGYLDVVSNFIAYKGYREAIDYYIETHNPYFYQLGGGRYGVKGDSTTVLTNKDFTIHQRFLLGKWQYVFTTNFDNALEFTNDLYDMQYLTIRSDYEMSRKKMARPIVKIHGSLIPSDETLEKPFEFDGDYSGRYIISREDFDNYLHRHEAFSYLLRVAMLSGSYCLLGFSGDDPNFKSWLNWVKDILDKEPRNDNGIGSAGEGAELLVKDDEDDIKVFLVLTDNRPMDDAQKLYYRNHHIGVIHLDSPEIRTLLRYAEDAPIPIKIDHFLKYIVGTGASDAKELNSEMGKMPSVTKAWRDIYNKLEAQEPIDDALAVLRSVRKDFKYLKSYSIQDYVLSDLIKKGAGKLTDAEKEALLYVITDLGVPSECLPEGVISQMEGMPGWEKLKTHDKTLQAETEVLTENNDYDKQENILRALYKLDFTRARQLLVDWQPSNEFETVKASIDYYYNRQDSLKTLDSVIMNADSDAEKYLASFLYDCIESGFMATYPLSEFKDKGIIGLNDEIQNIIRELKENEVELNTYGTETVQTNLNGDEYDNPAARKSYRFLSLISINGFNLCYGISNIINVADWYLVFKRLYATFPFACLYYSCQYNNRKVLRRIGQDFAFEDSLKEDIPEMLRQLLDALSNQDTPLVLMSGMLQIGSQLFWGMKEDVWFDVFYRYFSTVYVEEEGKYIYSGDSKYFVSNAIICLHDSEHLSKVVTVLLSLYPKMQDEVLSLLINQVRLNKLEKLNDEQLELIEKIAKDSELKSTAILLNALDERGFLPKEIKESFVKSHIAMIDEVKKSDRYTLFNFCSLAEEIPEAVEQLKKVILERNIWDCGVSDQFIIEAQPFFIMHLGNAFEWSLEEIAKISINLKDNLAKLTKKRIQGMIFDHQYQSLLRDMKSFADKYFLEEEVKKDIEEKLALVRHFDTLENGLYSNNPDAVETATDELNKMFRDGKFLENRHLFEVLLSKCTMLNAPGLSDCIVTIAVAVHFCGEVIKQDEELLKQLYRLLLQYKDKDLRDLDLRVIHAGYALLEVASFLNNTELADDNINYWLDNKNLTRLNYLEF